MHTHRQQMLPSVARQHPLVQLGQSGHIIGRQPAPAKPGPRPGSHSVRHKHSRSMAARPLGANRFIAPSARGAANNSKGPMLFGRGGYSSNGTALLFTATR